MNPVEMAIVGLIKLINYFIDKVNPVDVPIKKIINFNAATQTAMGIVFTIAGIICLASTITLGTIIYNFMYTNVIPTQLSIGVPLLTLAFGIYVFNRVWRAIGISIEGMWLNTKRVRVLSTGAMFSTHIGVSKLPNAAKTREQNFMTLKFSDEDGIECEILMDYKSAETTGLNLLDALYNNANNIYAQPERSTKRIMMKGTNIPDLKSLWDKHGAPERKIINFTPKKKD